MRALAAACMLSLAVAAPSGLTAQPSAEAISWDRATAHAAVAELAAALERDFVDPETGVAYARMLRARLAADAWADAASPEAFADAVTRDLHAIQYDGHLRLRPPAATASASTGPSSPAPGTRPPAMEQAGWISPGIAFVRFNVFAGEATTLDALRAFLREHRTARTLIIDARAHGGGEMDVLFPALFARSATLLRMDRRESVERRDGALITSENVVRVEGPAGVVRREHRVTPEPGGAPLGETKLFLLTSGRTASAAEHLALSMKRTGRATLIGETTAGAGNFGRGVDLSGGYSAFVPSGRTFDPDTNKGWDGVGITPHVATPAADALTEALVRSGVDRADAAVLSARYRPTGSMERRRPLRAAQ